AAAVGQLCDLLIQRFDHAGDLTDLDEVISLHTGAQRRHRGPVHEAPGAAAAGRALQRRARINASRDDAQLAFRSRLQADLLGAGSGRDPAVPLLGLLLPGASAAELSRLRNAPDLAERVDQLHRLIEALSWKVERVERTGAAFARINDEVIEAQTLLLRALPEDEPALHRSEHAMVLGLALEERYSRDGNREDATRARSLLAEAARTAGMPAEERIICLRVEGELAAGDGDWTAALDAYQLAVDQLPLFFARHLPRADHLRLLARHYGLVTEAASAAVRAGAPRRALELLERGRGLLIGQALDVREQDENPELLRIAEELSVLADRVPASGNPAEPSPVDRRRELARAWDLEMQRIRSAGGGGPAPWGPSTFEELRRAADDCPLIVVIVSSFGSDALVLAEGSLSVVPLPRLTVRELNARVDDWYGVLPFAEASPLDEEACVAAQEPLREVLGWLWDAVAGPVLDRLPGAGRVRWMPTGALSLLPLHAAGRQGDGAMDRVVSSYTPTIRLLLRGRGKGPAEFSVGIVTAPQQEGLPPLPGLAREAAWVAGAFPQAEAAGRLVRLEGSDATPAAVLDLVRRGGWLHFAGHAEAGGPDPTQGALRVCGGGVRVAELLSSPVLDGELAYLSACSTTQSDPSPLTDEVIHLGAAFQTAGFRQVIGTLWRVPDGTAAATARLFYREIGTASPAQAADAQVARALHRTLAELRRHHPLLPSRWAAYVHLG
ncbi:CHAT domain-containing protein, partial [Streptomyces sp. NPDC006332]|uniref:CHAT domain-containing protein n=1 Tax=Streptomyces sp. NPDC006332 TaxID=3155456 RepID=UPI0033A32794